VKRIFFLLFSLSSFGLAQDMTSLKLETPKAVSSTYDLETPVLLGHNLTSTSYTLKKNQLTVGTYLVGYGITDSFMISTSPWIDLLYNMPMINARYLVTQLDDFRVLVDANYFKTFPYLRNMYEQNSTFARIVASEKFSSFYTLHGSFGYQYFWDENAPYSLDPTPGNQFTTSLSTLHEMHWFKHAGTFFEAGVLGMNYPTPYLHLGVSRSNSMGMEYAVTNNYGYWYLSRVLWHPEVQFQAYF
jgi:hypothetical protein